MDKPITCVASEMLGKASRLEGAADRYIEFCKGTFPPYLSLVGLKLVIDCANGAAYHIAPSVFSELGAEIVTIGNKPNGLNINDECGATSLSLLQKTVIKENADLGIALDGDSDRVMMVDNQGKVLDGDQLLYILAKQGLKTKKLKGGVVGTLMSNMGIEIALAKLNIPFVRANVGDRYVMEQLTLRDWTLGGESSGHVICRDLVSTGDAIVAALQIRSALKQNDCSLSELVSDVYMMPQILINVHISKGQNPLETTLVNDAIDIAEKDMQVSSKSPKGRILIRKSGTESIIRVMVEAESIELADKWANYIAEVVRSV